MRIIGLAGWSGSGKTTLLTKVIPRIAARGLTVSTLKHAHHGFDIDQPGKDSHTHRMAGATEVLVGSASRWALVHELRGEAEPAPRRRCCASSRRSIWCWSKATSASAHPKLEVYRAANGKPLLHPDDPAIVAIAADDAAAGRAVPVVDLDDVDGIADHPDAPGARRSSRCAARAGAADGAAHRRLLRLLGAAAAGRRGRAHHRASASRRSPRSRRCRSPPRAGACSPRDVVAPIDLPPFDNAAVDGYAVRHADLAANGETRLAVVERVTAGRAAARTLAPGEAIRIFTGAPMPAGADTVFMQEDVRVDGDAVIGAARPQARRQPAARRRGRARRIDRAAGRPPARRAGRGARRRGRPDRACGASTRAGGGVLDRRRDRRARHAAAGRRAVRRQPLSAGRADRAARRRGRPTSASCRTIRRSSRARSRRRRRDHDLVLTTGGVSTGEADHVRSAVETRRPPGVLARRHQARPAGGDGRHPGRARGPSAAFVGLPGNPAAVYVTFARVVRPLLLRLAGAAPVPLVALPVRAAFGYRKKARPPRICAGQAYARRRRHGRSRQACRRRAPASSPR